MAFYFNLFSVIDHLLDLLLAYAYDRLFYPFLGTVAVKPGRNGIRNLKVQALSLIHI